MRIQPEKELFVSAFQMLLLLLLLLLQLFGFLARGWHIFSAPFSACSFSIKSTLGTGRKKETAAPFFAVQRDAKQKPFWLFSNSKRSANLDNFSILFYLLLEGSIMHGFYCGCTLVLTFFLFRAKGEERRLERQKKPGHMSKSLFACVDLFRLRLEECP
ncbi:hypothetical protein BX070DRAFT_134663 [Coemansia spiralis]|nr:hypothetical protein BX070DRAFT_134663 [Coemansia spiralis]